MKRVILFLTVCIGQAWALSCSAPVTISEPGFYHYWPKIALNEHGEALVLWRTNNDEEEEAPSAATLNADKKWSATALAKLEGDIFRHQPLIDEHGNFYAFWNLKRENDEGNDEYVYKFAKKEKNNSWLAAVDLFTPIEDKYEMKTSFDAQGNVLFLSSHEIKDSQKYSSSYCLEVMKYLHQSNEKKLTILADDIGYSSEKWMFRNKKGANLTLWSESKYESGKNWNRLPKTLIAAWSQEGFRWSTPATIFKSSHAGGYFSALKAVMNNAENVAILLEDHNFDSSMNNLVAITYFKGEWAEPVPFAISKENFMNVKIALNNEGDVVAAWAVKEKKKKVIYVANKSKGQLWSSPIPIFEQRKYGGSPKIAIDDDGNILVACSVKEGKKSVLQVVCKPVGQPWSSPLAMTNKEKDVEDVKVRVTNKNCFIVLWKERQKSSSSIYGATLSTATGEWSSAVLSPEGQQYYEFDVAFNEKGHGIIAWTMRDDNKETHIQAAELNID
ncbi:MAG: hypothetical protein JSS10_07300 [Verrucomicrobia bacterium]|nr:hypothetical protein [Verrucomicrobiota bacterium]